MFLAIFTSGILMAPGLGRDEPQSDAQRIELLTGELRLAREVTYSAHLVWTRTTHENGFRSPGCVLTTHSTYVCDVEGERISIDANEEPVVARAGGSQTRGAVEVGPAIRIVSRWDGNVFWACLGDPESVTDFAVLYQPEFRLNHNLLGMIFRSQLGDAASIRPEAFVPPAPDGVTRVVKLADFEGETALRVEYFKEASRMVLHFAIERGGYLIAEDWFDDGLHTMETRVVLGDSLKSWLPHTIVTRSLAPDGTATLTNRWQLDLARSRISDQSADEPPEFTMVPPAGSELSDYRGAERINYIVGDDVPTPAQLQELLRKARELVARKK